MLFSADIITLLICLYYDTTLSLRHYGYYAAIYATDIDAITQRRLPLRLHAASAAAVTCRYSYATSLLRV